MLHAKLCTYDDVIAHTRTLEGLTRAVNLLQANVKNVEIVSSLLHLLQLEAAQEPAAGTPAQTNSPAPSQQATLASPQRPAAEAMQTSQAASSTTATSPVVLCAPELAAVGSSPQAAVPSPVRNVPAAATSLPAQPASPTRQQLQSPAARLEPGSPAAPCPTIALVSSPQPALQTADSGLMADACAMAEQVFNHKTPF